MRKTLSLILALALALSFCIGLGGALVAGAHAAAGSGGAKVAWIDWIPGTPPPDYGIPVVNGIPAV